MLRNREFLAYMAGLFLTGAVGSAIAWSFHPLAGITAFLSCLLTFFMSLFFTLWRYGEIKKLSGYLRRIAGGDYALDVRDNREGELSILKSEIYKVTVTLREQAVREKSTRGLLADALSNISHQLKTPLTSLSIMTELLEEEKLPLAKRLEFTRNISSQIQRLKWLVESLLKLSRLDSGVAGFKSDQIRVSQLIERASEHLLIPLEIKEQTLEITGDPEVSFQGDFNWTREALANLLKNAMEHTPEKGRIEIRCGDTPLYASIEVKDTGPGIHREDLPYVFKRFYKGKNSHQDSAGIGLAMARSILEGQGGTLELKSTSGEGTVFTMKFYKDS